MRRPRSIDAACGLALAAALAACASPARLEIVPDLQSSKADGLASHLYLVDDYRVHVDEPSDLAFADGTLYAVSDRHSKIYELDGGGDVQDVLDVQGRDLEALAIDGAGAFYIADESRAEVWRLAGDGARAQGFEVDTTDGNSGIEGLAFDRDGNLLVAKEKHPATVIRLDPSGAELDREKLGFADDLSALAWNASDDHLYGLSAAEQKLFRFDGDFDLITSWKLPIDAAEGLAFDGDTVFIASDSDERIYVLELE